MTDQTYIVTREHIGDKPYAVNEKRILNTVDGQRLVELGVLKLPKQKAEADPANKMEPVPKNKAETAKRGHKAK